ncbi:MAG: aconitate hydratase AcnA [Candidatus Heimdallarchaeota archaeon]|nr:aconitate hydratase AcnA [Candidatus Heimdallarchaeota archaeon]
MIENKKRGDVEEILAINGKKYLIYNISKLNDKVKKLPFTIRILLEAIVRGYDGKVITKEDIDALINWKPKEESRKEVPFNPARVILQDFTGVPAIVDLAAMRSAMERFDEDPDEINPIIPVDLVIDHSVQVDFHDTKDALSLNQKKEFERNKERYSLLRWAQFAFDNFQVVPPGRGIVHQVNLEYFGKIVQTKKKEDNHIALLDTLVGTDSHTTMINGLGILGWGVGGIEAEAVMLGQPYYLPIPDVIGVKLTGKLKEGITATDLVLTVTQILREYGVVGKFVEFFGPGIKNLSIPDRATISNMSPEYGATCGFFPVDENTLQYLRLTNRSKDQIALIKKYLQRMGMFVTYKEETEPIYTDILELNLEKVEASLAGYKRPQDRIALQEMKQHFHQTLTEQFDKKSNIEKTIHDNEQHRWTDEGGCSKVERYSLQDPEYKKWLEARKSEIKDQQNNPLNHGSLVIAAITSCTNTSNPSVLIGAGLLAKKAVEYGLKAKPYVKTSLAPGSRVVTEYLKKAGLLEYLEKLGFYVVGYGCTTCIGNSGPLDEEIVEQITSNDLVVASILSGNRNFEGRINPYTKANYLASPILVVAYALAGTMDIDLVREPLGYDNSDNPIFLKDIWPDPKVIAEYLDNFVNKNQFAEQYQAIFEGTKFWEELNVKKSRSYHWDEESTYIREPPFFVDFPIQQPKKEDILNARVLVLLGDSITTDHISPAGAIPADGPAGKYLISLDIDPSAFNSFGSRRGNHEVMMRGTFGNIRLRNKLTPEKEGGWTKYHPTGEIMSIYDAAMKYQQEDIPLIVIAGKEYGTGSSRDWAAKGTQLLGVKAVIAESYERIHRSNLIGMGILPLQFEKEENRKKIGLVGDEKYTITGISNLRPKMKLDVIAKSPNHKERQFSVISRLDSGAEIEYYSNGGILHTVLRNLLKQKEK